MPNLSYHSEIYVEECTEKPRKSPVRIVGMLTEIQTGHLPNARGLAITLLKNYSFN